ncbi:hypothetical protein BX600DRAFT_519493 [Xylariales sp. PMI_506]|nr:hypothetical protein BX600DRAFT_519493 [Xylariales sp. PMI_506]
MATAETAELSAPHHPKEASIAAFNELLPDLKRAVLKERHDSARHELPYFASAAHLADAQLTAFAADDFELVRHAQVAYGHILFGKLRVPALAEAGTPACYLHFRAFEPEPGTEKRAEIHSIHTERLEEPDGGFRYRALFTKEDPLEWFDT